MLTIQVGGITFGGEAPDADGDKFNVRDLEGWDSPDVVMETSDRHTNGLYIASYRLGGRPMTLSGVAYQHSGAIGTDRTWRIRRKISQLAALLATGTPSTLLVNEPADGFGALQAAVVLSNPLRMRPLGPYGVEFEIPIMAPDPRKYGQVENALAISTTTLAVVNAGTVVAPLTATLNANITNPWVQNNSDGNRRVSITGAMLAGTVIDFNARTVKTAGGNSLYQFVDAASKWFELLVGTNNIQTNGNWTIRWRNAYL